MTRHTAGLEFAGEVCANFLGLTKSKYQWVMDVVEMEERERRSGRFVLRLYSFAFTCILFTTNRQTELEEAQRLLLMQLNKN
jgi:hypothetical protein